MTQTKLNVLETLSKINPTGKGALVLASTLGFCFFGFDIVGAGIAIAGVATGAVEIK